MTVLSIVTMAAEGGQQVAQGTWPGWGQLIVMAVVGVASGFAGGWMAAFRLGGRWQKVESRLDEHDQRFDSIDQRLASGKEKIDQVPVVQAMQKVVRDEMSDLKDDMHTRLDQIRSDVNERHQDLREDVDCCVTESECDRRHDTETE